MSVLCQGHDIIRSHCSAVCLDCNWQGCHCYQSHCCCSVSCGSCQGFGTECFCTGSASGSSAPIYPSQLSSKQMRREKIWRGRKHEKSERAHRARKAWRKSRLEDKGRESRRDKVAEIPAGVEPERFTSGGEVEAELSGSIFEDSFFSFAD